MRPTKLWVFGLWLAAFYTVWFFIVSGGDLWGVVREHWGIAVAMAAGSYVAGSTPMGGGTIGFPILVLLFEQPATLGRDFSFAVQSIGMTSASIFVLARRQTIAWSYLRPAMLGSLIGTPLGIFLIAPLVPAVVIKFVFAIVWASFGVLHLMRIGEIAGNGGMLLRSQRFERIAGLAIGFFSGALIAAVTGVGIDMVLYAVLVLVCRADLRIAIPTSVIIMAFTSLIGIFTKLAAGDVQPGVFENWLAAAPVVALGAPFGIFIVSKIGRKPTLLVVSFLCVGQFVWTCYDEWSHIRMPGVMAALAGVAVCNIGFEKLRRFGRQTEGRQAMSGAAERLEPGTARKAHRCPQPKRSEIGQ